MEKASTQKLDRYKVAIEEKSKSISKLFQSNGLDYSTSFIFLRAFKKEKELELWAKDKKDFRYKKLRSYPFCKLSGLLGPKRKEGDFQVPEGLYHINRFNEKSNFYLSLGINYPNKSDKILGDKLTPGSDIFIHGKRESIGCIPITDFWIKELFVISKNANDLGQVKIPVHIFPFKMTNSNLRKMSELSPKHESFWNNLQPFFLFFEEERKLRNFEIDDLGKYYLSI